MRIIELEDAVALKANGPSDHVATIDLEDLRRQGVGEGMLAVAESYLGRCDRAAASPCGNRSCPEFSGTT